MAFDSESADLGQAQGELVVVTGMTGAGRSTAAKELEDLGYFVVDNLPPELVGDVVQLPDKVATALGRPETVKVRITDVSFGFTYGVPVDADVMADMRFLPTPHWVPEVRHRTGKDGDVAAYVKDRADAQEFLERYVPV